MQDLILRPGWETILVAVPFVLLLFAGMFRLDEVLATHKKPKVSRSRQICGVDDDGATILCDPDGRPWRKPRLRK